MHELRGKVAPGSLLLRAPEQLLDTALNPYTDRILKRDIDLPLVRDGDYALLLAESMHETFWVGSAPRMDKLEQLYKELDEPEDLIVMLCCKNFIVFLGFWLRSCAENNIEVLNRTLVFTLDAEADSQAKQLGLKTYFFDPDTYQQAGAAEKYADGNFLRTMFYKNAAILESLKLGANILFQDVDLIWLKDPLAFLPNQNTESHLQIMYDGPNERHYPYYANTGFFYLRNEPVSHALIETALGNTASIFILTGHQPPFNRICHHFAAHNLLGVTVLAESQYLNGHLFSSEEGLSIPANDWQNSGIVIHYSWTSNRREKIRKLEKFNYFERTRAKHKSKVTETECKVTVQIEGLRVLDFYTDSQSSIVEMLRSNLANSNDDQLIYLNYGEDQNDALYFMSSDLLSVETDLSEKN